MRYFASLLIVFVGLTASWADDLRTTIDREIAAKWQEKGAKPTGEASDAEFLRRVYLDLVGTIPTWEEAAAFLDDTSSDKRAKLVDKLLADPRYSQHQADLWDLILFTRNPASSEAERRDGIRKWLVKQFDENVAYDVWVRTLLKAEGNSVDDGPPLYFVQYRSRPEDASEAISQTFLGVQLQCARCHDHPYETWSQLDFYGMAAFLARLQVVNVGKEKDLTKYAIGEKSTGDILFTGPAKEQEAGKKGDPVKPKYLAGDPLAEPEMPKDFKEPKMEDNKPPEPPQFSRKNQLADWIATPDNRYFARAIANRLWAQYMGRGLVHPVDNMSEANAPSHPQLLDALAKELVEHKFDLKWFVRELVQSKTYALSSAGGSDEPLPLWFEHGRTRPLSAEELADSWKQATWHYEVAKLQEKKEESRSRFHPLERDYMIRFFGTPNSGAGDFQGGLQEHLYLNNSNLGGLFNESKGSLIAWLRKSEDSIETKIERIYLSTLSRRPSPDEAEKFQAFITSSGKEPRWPDAVWAILSCSEFRFCH